MVTTQVQEWYETYTQQLVEVTSPTRQRASQGTAREQRVGVGPCRSCPLGRQRLSNGDLRAGRHAAQHRERLVSAR